MKIVWTNQFAQIPESGGGTRHFELARELLARGIETTIIAGNRNYLSGERVFNREGCRIKEGINFCTIDIAYKPGYVKRAYSWLEFAFKLLKYNLIFKEADIIIGSTPTLFCAYSTLRIARKYRKKFILEVRDLWPEILAHSKKLSPKSPIYKVMRGIASKLYKQSDYIITLSKGQKDYIKEFTNIPIEVVYNSMSDKLLTAIRQNKKYAGFNVVYAGALGYANDIDTLLAAIRKLREENGIKFHIMGGGPYKDKITEAIKKELLNLTYYGMLSKEKALTVMKKSHVGLLILRDIPLFKFGVSPNKLFDYLSTGLYIISTVGGEMGEIVSQSQYGSVIKPSDPDILAQTILGLYAEYKKNPEDFKSSNGIEYVKAHFSRDIMAEKLARVILETKCT